MGITLAMSSTYQPQLNGQTEALNRCLELYLLCFTVENPKCWVELLPCAELWYNISYQSNTKMTWFKWCMVQTLQFYFHVFSMMLILLL